MLHLHFSSLMSSACVVCVVIQLRGKQTYSDFSLCLRISLFVFVFFLSFRISVSVFIFFSQCSYYIFFLCICIFRPVFVFLSPSSYFSLCLRIFLSVFVFLSLSSSFWTENWIWCFVWSDVGFSSVCQTITKCAMILAFIFCVARNVCLSLHRTPFPKYGGMFLHVFFPYGLRLGTGLRLGINQLETNWKPFPGLFRKQHYPFKL